MFVIKCVATTTHLPVVSAWPTYLLVGLGIIRTFPPHLPPYFLSHRIMIQGVHPCLRYWHRDLAQIRRCLLQRHLRPLRLFRRYHHRHLRCRHRHRRLHLLLPMRSPCETLSLDEGPIRTSFFSSWSVNNLPIGTSQENPRFLISLF